ncbi:MAG TPA: dienelactone hydrolase family protein [Chitinophagaceae bacterium]
MHTKKIITAGKSLKETNKALIMVHGRGATAEDILSLAGYLTVSDYALIAPQATNNTWYPFSFLAPPQQNEPWLSSALSLLNEIVTDLNKENISTDHIYFAGFSQGACLTLEFVTRNAKKYGGVAAFTGGLVGDKIYAENYKGDFQHTPVFIGLSNPDPHIPVQRVHASTDILQSMHASVTTKIYDNMGHTINEDEIQNVNRLIFSPK